jgi:glycerol kinase
VRPRATETTVLGAAFLAGLGAGVWGSIDELADVWQLDRRFEPQMVAGTRERLLTGWRAAVQRSAGWAQVADTTEEGRG